MNQFASDNQPNFRFLKRHQLALLAVITLIAYYPANFSGLCSVDDRDMVASLMHIDKWTLKEIFIPGSQSGIYYRPVLLLSFILDKYIWELAPGIMHLENVLLHIVNSLLVYWLAYQMEREGRRKGFLPLIAALLFAVHPVNTESVNWISGRTDIMACIFILLATNYLLKYKNSHSYISWAVSALFILLGCLTKEAALAFLPGVYFILKARDPAETEPMSTPRKHAGASLSDSGVFLTVCWVSIMVFFILRSGALLSNDSRIGMSINFMLADIPHSAFVVLKALGFYIKKLFWPFPLNFTIVEVDPLYELLAVPAALGFIYILSIKTTRAAIFASGIFLIAPAFPIAFEHIAWTPFAERYLYMPSAFCIVASVTCGRDILDKASFSFNIRKLGIAIILLVFLAATLNRSVVWSNNTKLFADTVEKNPHFHRALYESGIAFADQGDIVNARKQFEMANAYNKSKVKFNSLYAVFRLKYWDWPDLALADLLVREGKLTQAIAAYEHIFAKSEGKSYKPVEKLVMLYGKQLQAKGSMSMTNHHKKKLLFYGQKLYNMNPDPYTFYWIGKLLLVQGDTEEAARYFREAHKRFRDGDTYKTIARAFVERIENE